MTFAYADPPYVGMAHRYEGGKEVNHRLLIQHLVDDYPDGWALSCHTPSLRAILALCPENVRVGAWTKPWCSFKPTVKVAYAWEPVIFTGGRPRPRDGKTVRDYCSAPIAMGRKFFGAKPDAFCYWLFSVLNVQPGDEVHDLFPGSGAVTKALGVWMRQYGRQLSLEGQA